MSTEKPIRIYAVELIFAVALIGGIIVFAIFGNIWDNEGLITSWFSLQRFIAVFAAILLGLVIGWMIFPRVPADIMSAVLGDPDIDPKETMTWANRREGVNQDGKLGSQKD